MARITSGLLKGMKLAIAPTIRPTEEKVRQAIWNILAPRVQGARVLDLFAGSGALGLEALSRGAAFVTFVELDRPALSTLRDNIAEGERREGPELGEFEVVPGDAVQLIERQRLGPNPYDIILLDPPYHTDLGKNALNALSGCVILAATGVLCLEHARDFEPPEQVGLLALTKRHRYGGTVLSFYEAISPSDESRNDAGSVPGHL